VRLAAVPLSPAAAKALAADPALVHRIVATGDDYEVLATVAEAHAGAFGADALAAGVAVTAIGTIGKGEGVVIEDADGNPIALDRSGWDHF
jgi:thiamine-monophosphate kinase